MATQGPADGDAVGVFIDHTIGRATAEIERIGRARLEEWLDLHADELDLTRSATLDPGEGRLAFLLMQSLGELGPGPSGHDAEDPGVQDLWEHLAATASNPLVAALAARNLWLCRCGNAPYEYAHRSVTLFRQVADGSAGLACQRAEALVEALEVAATMNARDLLRDVVQRAMTQIDEQLALCRPLAPDEEREAGRGRALTMDEWVVDRAVAAEATQHHAACIHLLRGLVSLSKANRRSHVDRTRLSVAADRLAQLVAQSQLYSERVHEIRVALSVDDPAKRRCVIAEYVVDLRAIALASDGARRYVLLTECEQQARDAGLSELSAQLRVDIQSIPHDELGLQLIRTTFDLPTAVQEVCRQHVASICLPATDSLAARLARLARDGMFQFGAADVGVESDSAVLSGRLVLPTIVIGHHNAPARVTGDGRGDDLASRRALVVPVHFATTMIVVPALEELAAAPLDDLVAALHEMDNGSGMLDEQRALSLAEAIRDWSEGRSDAALHAVVPRIEHLIRQAAALRDLPVIAPTDGTRRGGHHVVTTTLDALDGHVDAPLLRHLRTVLVDDAGLNLRNDVAHGDVARGTRASSALAIHTLLLVLNQLAPKVDR